MRRHISPEERERFISDGYLVMRGLLPPGLVRRTHDALLTALEIAPDDRATWTGKNVPADPAVVALTDPCRTGDVEAVAEELVGPAFRRGEAYSPYLEARGVRPARIHGWIPVLNFPTPGPREFQPPTGWHIDGMHLTTLWPVNHYLIVFAYLSDTCEYGGATAIRPGSHRQVFTHWLREEHPGSTVPPDLPYADPMPLPGAAGDVIFMHYLLVHSGSANHSDHIRVGLNTAVMPDPQQPYVRRAGPPQPDWTPLDWTLRTDDVEV